MACDRIWRSNFSCGSLSSKSLSASSCGYYALQASSVQELLSDSSEVLAARELGTVLNAVFPFSGGPHNRQRRGWGAPSGCVTSDVPTP